MGIPDEVRRKITGDIEPFRALSRGISWVRSEGIHLTLKFLGDCDPDRVDAVSAGAWDVAGRFTPFDLGAEGRGIFPDVRQPRVFWIGIQGATPNLLALAEALEARLETVGFDRESRLFHGHLTVGRVRRDTGGRELEAMARRWLEAAETSYGSFRVDRFLLMESTLKPGGAVYTAVEEYPLVG